MKKVVAIVGTGRKRSTHNAVLQFLKNLQSLDDVESEIVVLNAYRLDMCRGCKLCFHKGEEHCPLKDDRDVRIDKLMAADEVVFASPNYSYQVSATMKAFLDRLGFVFHRPRFFGKTFTSIVVQGIYGGGKIVKYLDFVGNGLGFNSVKATCVTALEPLSQENGEATLSRADVAQTPGLQNGPNEHEAAARRHVSRLHLLHGNGLVRI